MVAMIVADRYGSALPMVAMMAAGQVGMDWPAQAGITWQYCIVLGSIE